MTILPLIVLIVLRLNNIYSIIGTNKVFVELHWLLYQVNLITKEEMQLIHPIIIIGLQLFRLMDGFTLIHQVILYISIAIKFPIQHQLTYKRFNVFIINTTQLKFQKMVYMDLQQPTHLPTLHVLDGEEKKVENKNHDIFLINLALIKK